MGKRIMISDGKDRIVSPVKEELNPSEARCFLVMDTVCFLNYISEQTGKKGRFDYEGVKAFIESQKALLVITPYTLYESIQGCSSVEEIKERCKEMTHLWNFWVLNMNQIIGKDYELEFGPDFTFSLNMGIGTPEDFVARRRELRRKITEALTPRIISLAQMIAVVYMMATEQKENGSYDASVIRRIQYALSGYFQDKPNFNAQIFVFFETPMRVGLTIKDGILLKTEEDAKDSLRWVIHDFAVQIMNVTKVMTDEESQHIPFSVAGYNGRIIQESIRTNGMFEEKEMRSLCKRFLKNNKNIITLDGYVEEVLKGANTIYKHLFKKVLSDWFERNGAGKELMNTIIDYANVGVVKSLSKFPVFYMTEEKKFVELIMGLEDENLVLTQAFYRKYYKGLKQVI